MIFLLYNLLSILLSIYNKNKIYIFLEESKSQIINENKRFDADSDENYSFRN